jgi:hypothetical protein
MIGLPKRNSENMGGCREHDGGRGRIVQSERGASVHAREYTNGERELSVTWPGDANGATGWCAPGAPRIRMRVATCKATGILNRGRG